MTRRNSWPNKNSHITGWMTLNASTHGCLTRACSFLPVRYQVCAMVVRKGTVPGCAAWNRAVGLRGLRGHLHGRHHLLTPTVSSSLACPSRPGLSDSL
jgi:hypothetical protein